MARTGLLIVSNIKQISESLCAIEKYVKNLYIHLNIPSTKINPLPSWSKVITSLYVSSARLNLTLDLRVLIGTLKCQGISTLTTSQLQPIDMIFSDGHFPDICEQFRNQLHISSGTIYIGDSSTEQLSTTIPALLNSEQTNKIYNTVVLGGTFDRIHLGHKILLTEAVLRAKIRVVVGVMSDNTINNKVLPELILPVERRIKDVRKFLMEIDSTLVYDIVPIADGYGPTRNDPDMDMIIVSAETLRGGHKVNEVRVKNNLRPLEIYCIDILEADKTVDGPKEHKVSSSNKRIDLLGTRIMEPEPRPHLSTKPYIIGLTGGIAAGKSKLCKLFQEKGAFIIDCDKIAHELYEPEKVCYRKIIQHFAGSDIIDSNSKRIDRQKLGSIVFSDPQQLEALNNIVWPELMLEVKKRIEQMSAVVKVAIIEAAVLLKAGWERECHEVWSIIIPHAEAVKRLMERNKLSEEEASKRVAVQMDNVAVVRKSNVVFSSLWAEEFTKQQANKAWQTLMSELEVTEKRDI